MAGFSWSSPTRSLPQVSQSTYAVDYRRYRNHIAELPTREIEAAIAIRDHWIATLTPDTAKRTLTNINAGASHFLFYDCRK